MSDILLSLLGQPAASVDVITAMAEYGIHDTPSLTEPDSPHDETGWYDWLTAGALGVEFGFADQAYLMAHDPALRGQGPLILAQLYFYLRQAGVNPYQGPLPLGLSASDDRAAVRRKMGKLAAASRWYIRDVWDLQRFRLVVAYRTGDALMESAAFLLPERPWPPAPDQPQQLPCCERLVELFGGRWEDGALRHALAPLYPDFFAGNLAQDEVVDMIRAHGIELLFAREEGPRGASGGPVFTAFRLYRDRELDAYGWKGDMPFALTFDDAQPLVLQKVGREPDQRRDDELDGFALWHFPRFSLHVYYSNFANCPLRVTMMSPGFWQSAQGG
jgi:hypothetical protein